MASNQKLSKVIAGRALSGSAQADNLLTVTFADGSIMKVKTAPSSTSTAVTPGSKVRKVRQKGTELNLDLEDNTSWSVHLAEATSSVMLRDHAGKLEYAD